MIRATTPKGALNSTGTVRLANVKLCLEYAGGKVPLKTIMVRPVLRGSSLHASKLVALLKQSSLKTDAVFADVELSFTHLRLGVRGK